MFFSLLSFSLLFLINKINGTRIVCYTTNWSQYRPNEGKFLPENIDPFLCTHLIYAFAVIKDGLLASFEWNDESTASAKGLYERTTDLKKINPNLKVLLSVGGWNFGSAEFSRLVSDSASMQRFGTESVSFLNKYKFDGLDINWEYPANREGSSPQDKINYTKFIQIMRGLYEPQSLLLCATLAAGKSVIDSAYQVDKIINNLNFVNIMTYDYHGAWEPFTGVPAPLFSRPEETGEAQFFNVNFTINYYIEKGAGAEKLNLGLITYGRTFRLRNPALNQIGSPANGPGSPGQFTRDSGFLASYEICTRLDQGWTEQWNDIQQVPYAFFNDQWLGFDNERSLKIKIDFLKFLNLGGVMIWTMDMDDFSGNLCKKGKYPLINFIRSEIMNGASSTLTSTSPTSGTTTLTTATMPPIDLECPNGPGYYANRQSGCRKFYLCSGSENFRIYEFECPIGLLFDQDILACNYESQVKC